MLREMAKGILDRGFANRTKGEVKLIYVPNIEIPENRARSIDNSTVNMIYDSLPQNGLIQPIGVRQNMLGLTLVYGAHRLIAWRKHFAEAIATNDPKNIGNWNDIPCVVYGSETTDTDMRLLSLRENLERKPLTKAERDRFAARVLELLANKKCTRGEKIIITDK